MTTTLPRSVAIEGMKSERRPRARLALALAALAAIYVLGIALGDARAWSGSDAGGKVATVRYMAQHHTLVPEVGYWAADVDPGGLHHPLVKTSVIGHRFIQVTTYPLVYLALPLWHLGGVNGILVLPLLGSLLAAYAARRLALALGAQSGWWAFWLVGVASPMIFYAADFWEHSPAVGLALLALALALEDGGWMRAGAAGLAGGLAGVLRADALVYLAVAGVVFLLTPELRRRWMARPMAIVAAALGAATPVVLSRVAEHLMLRNAGAAPALGGRSASSLSQAGTHVPQRLKDGLVTAFGIFPDDRTGYLVLGVVVALALAWLAWRGRRAGTDAARLPGFIDRLVAAGVIIAFGFRFLSGLGFVPGMAAAAPLAAVGVATTKGNRGRAVTLVALAAILLIWWFQWRGELIPQWGGRYLLISGAALTTVAAVAIERQGGLRLATGLAVALAIGVSAFGVAWHVQRTRSVASAMASVEMAPPDVVIVSQLSHLGREAGAFYGQHRWLTSDVSGDLIDLTPILAAHRVARVDVVGLEGSSPAAVIPGYREVAIRHVPFLGFQLRVTRLIAQ